MTGAATVVLPLWLAMAGGGLALFVAALGAAQLWLTLRHAGRFGALSAQIARTGDTLEQDVQSAQEACEALQQQLGDAMGRLHEARGRAEEADRANQAKSAFLAMMSHELRTPLSAIIGFSEMIEQQAMGPLGNLKYRDYAGDIRQSGQHLLGIINDILDLSKVESGRETLREENIDLASLVAGVRLLVESRAGDAGVALHFDLPEAAPGIRADKRRLTQILVNLLSNAIKFTDAGGSVCLKSWATPGSGFMFQVIDDGIGMTAEEIPVALSVFGQIENTAQHHSKGTGLGLPLTKALAELHGGTLDLQSEPGCGTTATLRLPAHRILPGRAPRNTPPPRHALAG